MASALTPFTSTKETTNYARLCRLLVDVGSQSLRDAFDKIHPPATLHVVLNSHPVQVTLQSLYTGKKKVLNPSQWGKLYPPPHVPVSSAGFDTTLLTVLLRNICGLVTPAAGWDNLPVEADKNIEDDIARIKYYRNTLYGHASQASIDDASFNVYWQEIREALVRLGGTCYAVTIDNLKVDCMDLYCEEHYRKLLRKWKKEDESIKDQLEEIKEMLKKWKKDEDSTMDKLDKMEVKLEQMKNGMEDNIKSTFEQIKSGLEHNIRGTLEQMKEIKDILPASAAEKIDEEKSKDDLEQIKSEIMGNISEQLDILTSGMIDNIRDKFKQMRTEMEKMRGKLDTLRTVAEEKKNEGVFDPIKNINRIRQLYTSREGWLAPFPWCEEFHFHLNDIFTRLVMVSRAKKARGTVTRNVVDMSAIFQPHEECPEPRTVLIEGKPGMGKTTYCNKVAYDWATKKRKVEDCFPDFKLVLSLKCRDIESDLWEAIDDQLLPREIQEDERVKFLEFIRQNQSNVLLVLDGLDELPTSKLPEFSEIIQGRLLPGCHLVVTARHEAGIPVRKVCDTLLEIEGFTQQDAKTFIAKYFKTEENLAEKLLDQLENDKNLQEMVANPLNTALLCLLCEDFKGIPQRRTQLYLEIVQCVLRRYRKKNGLPENIEDLTEVYKDPLKHLGSIALEGLLEDNMYFADKQLGSHAHDLSGFGFLSVQPGSSKRRPCVNYGFLHKSFQELFSAFYICCQLVSEEISPEILVADARYFRELEQVLLFTCGMLAVQSEETAVDLIKSITNEVNKDELTKDYFPVALKCIKECKKERSNFHVELARTFGSCLKGHTVDLYRQVIGDAGAAVLGLALKTNTTLTKLVLSDNDLGPAGAEALVDMLKTNTTLTVLYLCNNNLGPAGAVVLADALKTNTTMTELVLSDNDLGTAGAKALVDMLKTNTTLTVLGLSRNNLGPASAEVLVDMLKTNTTLTVLDLSNSNLGTAGAALVADSLNVNSTLTTLYLYCNDVSEPVVKKLKEAHGDRVYCDFTSILTLPDVPINPQTWQSEY